MDKSDNTHIVDKVVEITTSKLSNSTMPPSKAGGEEVAAFMQTIYDKLAELYSNYN